MAYGEEHFGEQFSQALPEEGYALKSLKNYIWVHERVPLHVRRPELSWSHHQVIAKCDQALQVQWLERCVKGGWSLKEFRQQVKGQAKVKAAVPPPEPEHDLHLVQDLLPKDLFKLAPPMVVFNRYIRVAKSQHYMDRLWRPPPMPVGETAAAPIS